MTFQPIGESDDPLERLERNERQATDAIRYVLLSASAVVLFAVALVAFGGGIGERCTEPGGTCLTQDRVEVVLLPLLLSVGLSVTAGIKTYRRWKQHIRWRPWLFASYAMWMVTTTYLIGSSSAVFVQVG
ncbi:hypothetical protein CEY15_13655 [Dietzia natronolimnaea]|uniref:Integral membrane protein n=1 Tax=Dietzia natronolimnaea TaxID=161920 RepID=A0A2A2WMP2_9ACTN|nr:hypothetical protein [Dietzia natronolimnaea]PAY22425.1 hypothetical protein CEY15_13655 [Dietzia natronolimnaea]